MVADFFTFALATVVNLVTLMSGIVALATEGIRRWKKIEVPNHWYAYLIVVCLFLGSFQAWREEHQRAEGAQPRPSTAEIARTIGKLQRYERVTELVNGNTVMLKHDPVPETVYLILGGFSFHVIDEGDCRLEGRRIVLSGEREGEKLSYARTYLAEGDVKVQYLEQPK